MEASSISWPLPNIHTAKDTPIPDCAAPLA
jgi:hypothetical protein